jgi:threonylcarbamoyladenosine tRNA methylthiotransferase CDKAL1
VSIFEDPRVYKFLHLSVQSGSDAVLEKMARRHKVQEYLDIVHALRSYYPEFTISTDIIVGFPGETEQDFLQTLDLLQQTRPSVCNRTRFVSRKGTVAAKLEQSDLRISKLEKKRRSAELTRVFKNIALENNTQWVGWKGPILIEEPGKTALVNQQESIINWQGRNYAYKQVVVQGDFIPGDTVEVEIIRADIFYLEGRVISPQ